MPKNNGGPAFPRTRNVVPGQKTIDEGAEGMSLRDYLAAKAMQALILVLKYVKSDVNETEQVPTVVAQTAYEFADAMLAAREE